MKETNGCEGNKFLTRCTVNVEPIFFIRKVAKRMERQLDIRLIAEHENAKKKKKTGPQCVHVSRAG